MSRTVTATEAKNRLGALIADVSQNQDEIIIESHGRARAAVISIDVYEELSKLRQAQKRKQAVKSLFTLADTVSARNQDLTEEQAISLADEISHAAVDRLVEKGLVTFERDRREN